MGAAGGADWRPAASREALRRRAARLASIRAFFAERAVTEVETPVLAAAGVTDAQLDGFPVPAADSRWLQTSPEYAMKRLLAAGFGDCYQITRAFRAGERGRRHNPEFSLLEWYRVGFDHHRLMAEVAALVAEVLGPGTTATLSYAEAFRRAGLPDPLTAPTARLAAAAEDHHGALTAPLERDELLDLLFGTMVQAALPARCFVTEFPASQAALARLSPADPRVAERFELFAEGIELANGFHELTDPEEQRARFAADTARRRAAGRPTPAIDGRLLAALESGLPPCAGVALGLDRLFMLAEGADSVDAVMAFPWERA
ncbi:EF-P lysine aminoacylase EpmA [Sediminicurvatus halobius]|uniref:EF-P lysine aminoacylase GenX n=1 Tax=Sediminicurvatus halobius TaxID=2182432 RepID=A0A2U2MWR3_9GAMM|nr:EF-P lysine aminoacylase EpmA [Spiribacter halobius]PWG61299.1 EF-P lysine aminoacylase GenX [Spiribacter halobius]UEX78972.1 EF-P lysine aminoacylase GenX [Spiribacter halobius]